MATDVQVALDRSSPVPLYHQVATAFETAIRDGSLPPGTRLDNEIELAKRFSLSRPTMRQALDQLVQAGLVVRRRGIGTQVVEPPVRRPLQLSSLYDDLIEQGSKPSTEILELAHVSADQDRAELLGIKEGTPLQYLRRVRSIDGTPLAIMENWVPTDVLELDQGQLRDHGLYDLMRGAGIDFRLAHQRMGATVADKQQAALLDVEPGAPLVQMERVARDSSGRAVDGGHHLYRADLYSFEMTLVK
ncbi:GntR family transcriptional regulator [Kocuria sp. JC486]|uniref:GntR family transcriptional regulator n=1 Tax=Kocuria sp. JC486 TaxID=1970736 RepID=UPI00141DFA7C|nr:GntR family transcriptional regulator [Kocuria sp. JC486]NHU85944.1 GntR family transcriptional regulator [Kocuria sp. JC486]